MARLAVFLLHASAAPPRPDEAFVGQLRRRMADADEAIDALRRFRRDLRPPRR